MKKVAFLPIVALCGGGAAFVLRLMQNRSGFEADTGLPTPGNPYAIALIVLLLGLVVGAALLALPLPKAAPAVPFSAMFSTDGALTPTVLVMGAFLFFASGALSVYNGVTLFSRTELLLGVLAMLAAACLLPAIGSCRRHPTSAAKPCNGNFLLAPVGYCVVRLVLTSRADSINPSLEAHYPELLALMCLILIFYSVASFAFDAGKPRQFALWAMLAIVTCAATLADQHSLSLRLLYAAGILLPLGFLLLLADGLPTPPDTAEDAAH